MNADLIPCNSPAEVKVGMTYTVDFFRCTSFPSNRIPNFSATSVFRKKYSHWSLLTGKRVLILEKEPLHQIKFTTFPINDPKQYKTDSSGEWCFCSFHYLSKAQNHVNCSCNLWTTGCVCGLFKLEQNKKK